MTHTPNRRARLAREIRGELGRQGKTTAEFASALRLSPAQAVHRLEGKKPFFLEELKAAAEFLNLAAAELNERTDVAA